MNTEQNNTEIKNEPKLDRISQAKLCIPNNLTYSAYFIDNNGKDVFTERFLIETLVSAQFYIEKGKQFYLPEFTVEELSKVFLEFNKKRRYNLFNLVEVIEFINSPYVKHLKEFINQYFSLDSKPVLNGMIESIIDVSSKNIVNQIQLDLIQKKYFEMSSITHFEDVYNFVNRITKYAQITPLLGDVIHTINNLVYEKYEYIIPTEDEDFVNGAITTKVTEIIKEFITSDGMEFFKYSEKYDTLKEQLLKLNKYLDYLCDGFSDNKIRETIAKNIANKLVSNVSFNCLEIHNGFIITNLNSVVYEGILKNKTIIELNLILHSLKTFNSNREVKRSISIIKVLIENYTSTYGVNTNRINFNELQFNEVNSKFLDPNNDNKGLIKTAKKDGFGYPEHNFCQEIE